MTSTFIACVWLGLIGTSINALADSTGSWDAEAREYADKHKSDAAQADLAGVRIFKGPEGQLVYLTPSFIGSTSKDRPSSPDAPPSIYVGGSGPAEAPSALEPFYYGIGASASNDPSAKSPGAGMRVFRTAELHDANEDVTARIDQVCLDTPNIPSCDSHKNEVFVRCGKNGDPIPYAELPKDQEQALRAKTRLQPARSPRETKLLAKFGDGDNAEYVAVTGRENYRGAKLSYSTPSLEFHIGKAGPNGTIVWRDKPENADVTVDDNLRTPNYQIKLASGATYTFPVAPQAPIEDPTKHVVTQKELSAYAAADTRLQANQYGRSKSASAQSDQDYKVVQSVRQKFDEAAEAEGGPLSITSIPAKSTDASGSARTGKMLYSRDLMYQPGYNFNRIYNVPGRLATDFARAIPFDYRELGVTPSRPGSYFLGDREPQAALKRVRDLTAAITPKGDDKLYTQLCDPPATGTKQITQPAAGAIAPAAR